MTSDINNRLLDQLDALKASFAPRDVKAAETTRQAEIARFANDKGFSSSAYL